MKPMFEPEKCPKCGKDTLVEHYDAGWRCICDCGWYGMMRMFGTDNPMFEMTRKIANQLTQDTITALKEYQDMASMKNIIEGG